MDLDVPFDMKLVRRFWRNAGLFVPLLVFMCLRFRFWVGYCLFNFCAPESMFTYGNLQWFGALGYIIQYIDVSDSLLCKWFGGSILCLVKIFVFLVI